MADPKYAGLPGIAYDQPDVYESEDTLDTNFSPINNQDQSDCIENLSTNIKESFSKFEGQWLDARRADFSGKITPKKHEGYSAWAGPYELQAKNEPETAVQKLNRIQCELAELQEELATPKPEEVTTIGSLTSQVEFLQKQLMAIKLQETAGVDYSESHWLSKKKLFADLDKAVETASTLNSSSNEGKVVYELKYLPHQAKLETASKATNLMNRLNRLEQLLGSNSDKMTRLSAEMGQKSLTDAVRSMNSKVSLLEPTHLDQVEGRLGLLVQRLNAVSEKSGALEDADKQRKVSHQKIFILQIWYRFHRKIVHNQVSEVYEFMKKLEPLFSVLPTVVDRLLSLKTLHEEAVNFHQSLTQVESVQTRLDQSLGIHSQLLKDIQVGLASNIASTESSLKQFEERLSILKK